MTGFYGQDYPDVEVPPPWGEDEERRELRETLGRLLADLRTWQHLPDPTHVVAALAVAATRDADGEACWLLLVAPPSSGKTEAVRLLDDAADARLDEVTVAGLLGWTKGKTVRPTGVLMRVGPRALVTFGDLSTLLATSDRGGRDQVFGHLRRAYDGHVTRDISPPGKVADGEPDRLEWSGRLTVVGCVTGAIDRYTAHADQLGARWLYVRLPDRTTEEKRRAAALARRGSLPEHRAHAREAVARILTLARPADQLPEDLALHIEDAALVTAWGRGAVPRNGYGRREIEGVPVVEEPMRLVQQLGSVARGVLALGLPVEAAAAITRRVALDSMPEARRAVLSALSTGEVLTTSGVARAARLDRKVARMTLEDLAAIGVVANDRAEDEDEELTGPVNWALSGEDGALIAEVFAAHRRCGGWDEKWVYTSTSPPERGDIGSNPTLRPTPAVPPLDISGDESGDEKVTSGDESGDELPALEVSSPVRHPVRHPDTAPVTCEDALDGRKGDEVTSNTSNLSLSVQKERENGVTAPNMRDVPVSSSPRHLVTTAPVLPGQSPPTCLACGLPLHALLTAAGHTTHPTCLEDA